MMSNVLIHIDFMLSFCERRGAKRNRLAYIVVNEVSMDEPKVSEKDSEMAKRCLSCPVCARARKKQRGIAFWFVKHVENAVCPYCSAYERVYGKKAHES